LGTTLQSEDVGLYLGVVQMREWAATLAKILLIAITLFHVGPQLGSLDIDGDGIPDIPVVVTHVTVISISISGDTTDDRKSSL